MAAWLAGPVGATFGSSAVVVSASLSPAGLAVLVPLLLLHIVRRRRRGSFGFSTRTVQRASLRVVAATTGVLALAVIAFTAYGWNGNTAMPLVGIARPGVARWQVAPRKIQLAHFDDGDDDDVPPATHWAIAAIDSGLFAPPGPDGETVDVCNATSVLAALCALAPPWRVLLVPLDEAAHEHTMSHVGRSDSATADQPRHLRARNTEARTGTAGSACVVLAKNRLGGDDSASARRLAGLRYAIKKGASLVYAAETRACHQIRGVHVHTPLLASDGGDGPGGRGGSDVLWWSRVRLADVYGHFGWPAVYPRGYRPNVLANDLDLRAPPYHAEQLAALPVPAASVVGVIQGLVDRSPVIDPRSPGAPAFLALPFAARRFCADVPPVALDAGVFGPLTGDNTVYRRVALWAAVAPLLGPAPGGSLWAQRLLWDAGLHLLVQSATVDGGSEAPFRSGAGAPLSLDALDWLVAWQSQTTTLPARMVELAAAMAEAAYLPTDAVETVRAWVLDLQAAGYAFPALLADRPTFSQPAVSSARPPAPALPDSVRGQMERCTWRRKWSPILQGRFANIVVGVHFNHDHFAAIPTYMDMYGPAFPNLVFIAPSTDTERHPPMVPFDVVRYTPPPAADPTNAGALQHGALLTLIDRFPGYVGYLHTNDDVFLDFWRLARLPLDRIWFRPWTQCNSRCLPFGVQTSRGPALGHQAAAAPCRAACATYDPVANVTDPPLTPDWDHWPANAERLRDILPLLPCWAFPGSLLGLGQTTETLASLGSACINPFTPTRAPVVAPSLATTAAVDRLRSAFRFVNGGADLVFLPHNALARAVPLLELFYRHGIYLEIAVPSTVLFSVPPGSIHPIQVQYGWTDGATPEQLLATDDLDAYHPVKLSDPAFVHAAASLLKRHSLQGALAQLRINEEQT